MKTKLLKKVRKRYSLVYYSRITAENKEFFTVIDLDKNDLPVFLLKDKTNYFRHFYASDKSDCLYVLSCWIKKDYYFLRKRFTYTSVCFSQTDV